MKPGQIEQVSEELAANLPVCPKCGSVPEIHKRINVEPIRMEIAVWCPQCSKEWYGFGAGNRSGIYPTEAQWHPSLFEAVNIWSLTAKLLGSQETVGPDLLAGQIYTDRKTGETFGWNTETKQWEPATNDVPF